MSDETQTYDPNAIEAKWQRVWEDAHAMEVPNDATGTKSYVLEQLPYPSGSLHLGHLQVTRDLVVSG